MSSPKLPPHPGARRPIGRAEHPPTPEDAPGVDPALDLAPDEVLDDGTTWEDVLATDVEADAAADAEPDGYARERQQRAGQRGEGIEPDGRSLSRAPVAPPRNGAGAAPTVPLPAPAARPEAPPTAAVAPAAAEGREPSVREWLSRRWLFGLAYWQALLMGGLLVALVLTRFYDLGVRAMHHDESMHAKFAWDTFHGQIYKYNPLLHGPFQFLAVAASFWLFGATEWTARAVPATFGILLVLLTFFWRRWLGALGWLFAVAIFVFSPSFTYFARMLREDSYTATWTLLAATGLVGYVLHRGRPWYYAFCAGLAMAFATKESTYITAFIFGTFMICSLLWEQGGRLQRRLVAGAATGGILGAFYSMVMDQPILGLHKKDLHEIGGALIGMAIGAIIALAYDALQPRQRPTGTMRRAPAAARGPGRRPAAAVDFGTARPTTPRGTFTTALLTLWRDDAAGLWGMGTFWTGVLLFAALYILFFSSFFTNLPGIREGLIGSISYWLEQHSVQRGNQPWYYYLLILSAYETLEWVFAFVATIYYLRRPTWLTSFLIWWWVLAVVIYSWAGEKMPWLTIHIALPMVLLTARYLGELFTSAARSLWEKRLALAGLAVLGIWTIHTGWPVNFERPDTPKDLLVYTQTAPDVKKVMADIERISLEQTGDAHAIGITVQSGTWWPFSWYLRDFKNVDYPAQLTAPATKPIVLVAVEDDDKNRPFLQGYTRTRYKMRWWYPEDYRNITLQTIFDLFSPSPQGQAVRAGLWNWLIYREPTQPLGSYDFYVYLKEGIAAPSTGAEAAQTVPASQAPLAQQQPPQTAQQQAFANPVEYAARIVPLTMLAQWGSAGKASGQLNTPRALALDSQGNIYVADSLNHRIQKFDPTGKFLFAWGTQGGGDGQFNEPMGVAVDADGNIYVADTWNHRIQKFDPTGKLLTKWTGQGGFWGPRAVALDGQGNVYVMDTGNKRIQKFDANGRYLSTIGSGGSGPGQLNEPIGMAVTAAGEIYVADTNNHRIEKFDAAGQFVTQWPIAGWNGNVRNEPYLTLDADGNLYATDPPNGRIIKFSPTGEVLGVAGTPGSGPGQLSLPTGIAASADRLYIADTGNNRIQVVAPLP